MSAESFQKRNGYFAMGGIGFTLSVGYLGMSFQLPFGKLDQPGAGLFPVVVGVMLMLASLATLWEGWKMQKAELVEVPVGADLRRLLSLVGLLFGYFLLMPWLGHMISSVLFCLLLIRVLSELSWPRVTAYALVMAIMLYAIFVYLLKVPMPRGALGF
jgi:putative tricarboxylic transport membrane protein